MAFDSTYAVLTTDEANMITGTILPIDGGWTAK